MDCEDEAEEEAYYHLPKTNQDCSSLAIESHSCQTYEDHATQTEDEDSENELKEDFLPDSHFHGAYTSVIKAMEFLGVSG